MKKTTSILVFFLFHCFITFSQNLVPNHSFENISQCPTGYNQIFLATPWFQPCIHLGNTTNSSSSDVFDTCSNYMVSGIPTNNAGFQYAMYGGHGYAGIILHADTLNYREYLEVQLDSALIVNKKYDVRFYVSLVFFTTAISNCGAYFSVDSLLDTTNLKAINYVTPQIENQSTNFLNDTANWMLVSGSFIASGGERFMTIGNFDLPSNTNVQNLNLYNGNIAYYFIDDVSVVYSPDNGVDDINNDENILIIPNPASDNLTVQLKTGPTIKTTLTINNVIGEHVYTTPITTTSTEIDISSFAKGLYIFEVNTSKRVTRNKVTLQ